MNDTLHMITVDEQAEIDYRRWVDSWLYHLDQIPPLLETTMLLAAPRVGVSRGGSRFDRPQVTGGGYIDNIPITDTSTTVDADLLWATLHAYLHAVATKAGNLPPLAEHDRLWNTTTPTAPPDARARAIEATGWLADLVEHVVDWPELAPLEDELFALIRRMKGRYRSAGTARRARPRACATCGEVAVVVDWVTPGNGSPKPVQVGVCRVCGQQYAGPA
ncbi:hypothetical protein ACIGCK_04950 [Microbacterium sp. NPDC078428]|uniref:hypothetical protein n=1 Tax=Microbacterium sp. NPDC078428 TaxID=3364190 RepID=UPI0037C8CAD7